jgi:tellurite resistance protein
MFKHRRAAAEWFHVLGTVAAAIAWSRADDSIRQQERQQDCNRSRNTELSSREVGGDDSSKCVTRGGDAAE